MKVAQQLKKENIIEYVLYMWQVEDLLRSYKLDTELINKTLVSQYKATAQELETIQGWYAGLVLQMKEEGIKEKGHLQSLINTMNDLNDLHLYLLKEKNPDYMQLYSWAKSHLDDLYKLTHKTVAHELEAGLNGLYGYLLLKYQKREVSKATQESVEKISKLFAALNNYYLKLERGELSID